MVEGVNGEVKAHRSWEIGTDIEQSRACFLPTGQKRQAFSLLGWADALANYRPFLPYNELGAMFDSAPLQALRRDERRLGLGDLVEAQESLRQERLNLGLGHRLRYTSAKVDWRSTCRDITVVLKTSGTEDRHRPYPTVGRRLHVTGIWRSILERMDR